METPEEYNDLNFWRLPVAPLARLPSDGPEAMITLGAQKEEEQEYNDFSYWRQERPSLTDLGMEERPTSPHDGSASGISRVNSLEDDPMEIADPNSGEEEEDEEDYAAARRQEPAEDPMGLLSGGAGARLLGLLGQLSQHLGAESRFARAAGMLQEDMQRQRDHAMRIERERAEEAVDGEDPEAVGAPPPPRIAPLEGSTLEQPEVAASLGSLLNILQENENMRPGLAQEVPQAPPLLLFDMGDTSALPPPSPASPESVAHLSPPCPSFALHAEDSSPSACPICLEPLADAGPHDADEPSCNYPRPGQVAPAGSAPTASAPALDGAQGVRLTIEAPDSPAGPPRAGPPGVHSLLQMPCAKQHVFHRSCLLKWLDARNTCPVCRHGLPEASPSELAAGAERAEQRAAEEEAAAEEAARAAAYARSLDA